MNILIPAQNEGMRAYVIDVEVDLKEANSLYKKKGTCKNCVICQDCLSTETPTVPGSICVECMPCDTCIACAETKGDMSGFVVCNLDSDTCRIKKTRDGTIISILKMSRRYVDIRNERNVLVDPAKEFIQTLEYKQNKEGVFVYTETIKRKDVVGEETTNKIITRKECACKTGSFKWFYGLYNDDEVIGILLGFKRKKGEPKEPPRRTTTTTLTGFKRKRKEDEGGADDTEPAPKRRKL